VYVKAQVPPSLGSNVFSNVPTTIAMHVPCGRAPTYQGTGTSNWGRFTNIIEDIVSLISVQSSNNIMGSVSATQAGSCTNNTATIGAIPNTGYCFVQWNDGDKNNPRTIAVTQDTTFTAIFDVIIHYHVTVVANSAVMGSVTGGGDYRKDSVVVIEALPNAAYRFLKWNDGNTQNPRVITVTKDTTFTATFELIIYHVTVTANNSAMGIITGAGDYLKDSTAIIGAIPNIGYRFVQWDDGNIQNPRTVTITGDTMFTAIFGLIMHHLTVTGNNSAMGIVTGTGDYPNNTTVVIGALANAHCRFVQWNDGNNQNPRTLTITSDTAFTAIFGVAVQGIFNVSAFAGNTTMGTVTGSGDFTANASVTIRAMPNTGYRFMQWNDGNTNNPRTITVTQDTVFTAVFNVEGMFHVSVLSNNSNMGTVTGSGDYAKDNIAIIVATPNMGYRFVSWNDGNIENPRSFILTQDTSFTAVFEASTGIKSMDTEASAIKVYPNPTKDNLNIVLPENIDQAVFTLYDMQSKVLIQQQISAQDVVSVSHLAAGIYIYNVRTEKGNYTGKVIRK
jgi:hypothetical protein